MNLSEITYVFVDVQNVQRGVLELGWKLDYVAFITYLQRRYRASKVFLFLGFLPEKSSFYEFLRTTGYQLVFKPVAKGKDGHIKGNVDAELVLHTMIEYPSFNNAILVSSDGDFACLVSYLLQQQKLGLVLSPSILYCSLFLKHACAGRIAFFDKILSKIAQKVDVN